MRALIFAVVLLVIVVSNTGASEVEVKCTPKTRFKFYCNTCWCSEEGTIRICTKKYCPDNIFNPDGTLKSPPNVHYKMKVLPKGVDDTYSPYDK